MSKIGSAIVQGIAINMINLQPLDLSKKKFMQTNATPLAPADAGLCVNAAITTKIGAPAVLLNGVRVIGVNRGCIAFG